ncbi:protoporphyrinogen oxidase [Niallia sp. Krafla_26]|uniref:protoporphyrinogen oxidase n=1 Tax=Niallia sp. Krafla_26 TaxID=3064703 RepID=UPI003D181FB5
MRTILVVGGGITGLSAMYTLQKWKKEHGADVRLILAEAEPHLGGKIRTVKEGSFLMETGADSIVTRKIKEMPIIKDLGLESEIVYNDAGQSYLFTDGELKSIPKDSVFGIPASIESLAKSTLVSNEGKVEALKDFYTKNEKFTKKDSVGEFLEHFLGKELVEKQIAPVLSGVYSGDLQDLTIESTLPYLLEYKEKYGSIIKGFHENKDQYQSDGTNRFLSFKNGLHSLIEGYKEKLEDVEIKTNAKVSDIVKTDHQYSVTFENGESIESDQIILSVPHTVSQRFFQDPALIEEFSHLKNSSMISIYIGFEVSDEILPLNGTGFITPKSEDVFCDACTWTSRKWKHTSPSGNLLVRLFYKSSNPYFGALKDLSEQELLQVVQVDLKKSLGINMEPSVSVVTNWTDLMPNYLITHPATVRNLEGIMEESYPGILLAGASYYGVGIPDCIENGENVAKKIIQQF